MDHESFDRFVRMLGTTGSRRAALAGLAGVALAGTTAAAKGDRRRKKRGRGDGRRTGRVRVQQVPANCFTNPKCAPGPGRNLSKCDYAGSATLRGKNLKGANLGNANLLGVDASGADLRGVNLGGACLTNADLSGAAINSSTNASTARYCGTIMPDGSINDRDCGRPTRCCEACTPAGDECNDETAPCCGGGACVDGTCVGGCPGGCGQGEICCNEQCLAGICCTNADCRPTGNQCVSAGGGPTACLCGLDAPCASGLTCCPAVAGPASDGDCANLQTDEGNCGTCGNACGPCQTCQGGRCEAVLNRSFACDGTPLIPIGGQACTAASNVGVCVDGACTCGLGAPNPGANRCPCTEANRQICAANPAPPQCCQVGGLCVDAAGNVIQEVACVNCD